MSPEALERLREVQKSFENRKFGAGKRTADDLRALLDAHDEAVNLLAAMEFDHLDNSKCPTCRGWNMSSQGETPLAHTKNCSLAAVLAKAGRR